MPVYDFECTQGHITESRQGRETETISCPCGGLARRLSVYRFNLGGGLQPKYRVSEFQEASQEANYYHDRMENLKGEPIPRIDAVREAKRKVRSMGAQVR